jgi:hypothetical protein
MKGQPQEAEAKGQMDKPECQQCFDWHGSMKCNFPGAAHEEISV